MPLKRLCSTPTSKFRLRSGCRSGLSVNAIFERVRRPDARPRRWREAAWKTSIGRAGSADSVTATFGLTEFTPCSGNAGRG